MIMLYAGAAKPKTLFVQDDCGKAITAIQDEK